MTYSTSAADRALIAMALRAKAASDRTHVIPGGDKLSKELAMQALQAELLADLFEACGSAIIAEHGEEASNAA